MAVTADDYLVQLQALLPQGTAWPRDAEATLTALLGALAEELARLDARALALIEEADPRTTSEMLTDWERVLGLPDACVGLAVTLQERRAALLQKIIQLGGQSRQFFIDAAGALGFAITITEFPQFTAGAAAGDALSNGAWVFTWRSNGPAVTIVAFRAGLSAAGEPLRNFGNQPLECTLTRLKPAHTLVQFAYGP